MVTGWEDLTIFPLARAFCGLPEGDFPDQHSCIQIVVYGLGGSVSRLPGCRNVHGRGGMEHFERKVVAAFMPQAAAVAALQAMEEDIVEWAEPAAKASAVVDSAAGPRCHSTK